MPTAPRIEPDPGFRTSFQEQISRNKLKSYALTAAVFLVLFAFVWVLAEIYAPDNIATSIAFGLVMSAGYILVSYYWGDNIVLSSTGAQPLDANTPKGAYLDSIVEGLCIAARIPKPKIYVIQSTEMNAFATGRDPEHSSIAFTTAIVEKLNRTELEGVAAHELSHVANYDVRFNLVVAVMVGLISILAHIFVRSMWFGGGRGNRDREGGGGIIVLVVIGLVLSIIAPILVRLVQLAISRKRELLADASGARLTRYPEGLASALEKLASNNKGNMPVDEAVSHLFFADPTKTALDDLFATHPPIEERIKLLRAM
jgi:heat shock protein HtpX